jgi:hypothetical protein
MYKYDGSLYHELIFNDIHAAAEERGQWIDVYIRFKVINSDDIPSDLVEPSGLLICDKNGDPVQYVVLDEGCDTEYQFTNDEKKQIMGHIEDHDLLQNWLMPYKS